MLTLKIENENIEHIFLNEFHSNREKFFEFIQSSYEKMKIANQDNFDKELVKSQETSMFKTWDNDKDEAWDEL
jgi:hypothetical protein